MRKVIVAFFAVVFFAVLCVSLYAAESVGGRGQWSKYESGTNNVRVDGYQGQPGYISFVDDNGDVEGYLFWNALEDCLAVSTDEAIDLSTAKLKSADGVCVGLHTGQ